MYIHVYHSIKIIGGFNLLEKIIVIYILILLIFSIWRDETSLYDTFIALILLLIYFNTL